MYRLIPLYHWILTLFKSLTLHTTHGDLKVSHHPLTTCSLYVRHLYLDRNLLRGCSKDRRGAPNSTYHCHGAYTPLSTQNFLALCASNYYDGCLFHRNIKGFMVQTGDPTGTGKAGQSIWGSPFPDEIRSTLKVLSFFHSHRSRLQSSAPILIIHFFSSTLVASLQWQILAPILTSLSSSSPTLNSLISTQSTLSSAR